MKKYTVQRILMENDIDLNVFIENIKAAAGGMLAFKLELAGCENEKDVEKLVFKYV